MSIGVHVFISYSYEACINHPLIWLWQSYDILGSCTHMMAQISLKNGKITQVSMIRLHIYTLFCITGTQLCLECSVHGGKQGRHLSPFWPEYMTTFVQNQQSVIWGGYLLYASLCK